MQKTVSFTTLGCKVNQYDTQAMLELFEQHGYSAVSGNVPADVYVVNTCTVTGSGDKKSMQLIRRCRRRNPQAELIVCGCLAQRMGAELLPTGARLILGNQYRGQVVELLEEAIRENVQKVAVGDIQNVPYETLTIHAHEGHTRAVMKIQEGCDNRCTYCIIPSVRGNIRSRTLEDIRREAEALAMAGFQELVLTGIHLTSYGRDLEGRPSLADAMRAANVEGVSRIRLGSLEPRVANEAFVAAAREMPELCPQFHLALQSGSDQVLRRMKRGYNTTQFLEAVQRIRAAWPDAAFTTDVIVGFPGETEEEFQETIDFCRKVGFSRLHVFPFSPREGTPAAEMDGQLPEHVKSQRVNRLIQVGNELADDYRQRFIGRKVSVLVEDPAPDGGMTGYTPEYIHVVMDRGETGRLVTVELRALTEEGMSGVVVD
ncbi:MAG: tRNA (N(6)-L-threonylcarbamoyladenosine(37)-C(2))-methylthiotransferase MtaB [Clostridia bacterium]|nr:tRNA (N(6)-L-threonylcarbamoyladenosine(37)-C(2))-methylthiotransferase MtaB [Clostridia bacterium]